MQHITASDVNVMFGTTLVNVRNFSLSIEDGAAAVKTRGISHGWVNGEVSASGEMKVDTENLMLIIDAANEAGSFQQVPLTDVITSGKTKDQSLKVAAFGCKLVVASLIDAGNASGDVLEHTLPYFVSDRRFVEINGVPYLDQNRLDEIGT